MKAKKSKNITAQKSTKVNATGSITGRTTLKKGVRPGKGKLSGTTKTVEKIKIYESKPPRVSKGADEEW